VGVAVVKALEAEGLAGVELKWPNDLVHKHLKVGGILVELNGDALGPSIVVVGVGPQRSPAGWKSAATSSSR
jgi:BirA family biotin operon repressor/biotin-[acetyl-CoA-carboxylase] ligase